MLYKVSQKLKVKSKGKSIPSPQPSFRRREVTARLPRFARRGSLALKQFYSLRERRFYENVRLSKSITKEKGFMFTKVESKDFVELAPFAEKMPQYMGLRAIVEGSCPHAIIFQDSVSDSAIISLNSRLYLFGEAGEVAFASTLKWHVFPLMRQKSAYSVLHYSPESLKETIPTALSTQNPHYDERLTLILEKPPKVFELPIDYQVAEVNEALLANTALENHAALVEECCSERPSVEDFLAKSFGLCLIKDGALVGWCLSEYNNSQGCEVGIEINEDYQKQGLGSALASAFAQLAQERGIKRIGWHCWKDNLPSVALAKKLGFELAAEEAVFVLKLN
jgi:RimJ/RimL family protein N-acetyltransferase